jgi:hypothetical protein
LLSFSDCSEFPEGILHFPPQKVKLSYPARLPKLNGKIRGKNNPLILVFILIRIRMFYLCYMTFG